MANEYLNRQDILLETLQDVEKLVGEIQPGMKLTEVVAARMATALQMIYMAARRHPDWTKPEAATLDTRTMPEPVTFEAVPATEPIPEERHG